MNIDYSAIGGRIKRKRQIGKKTQDNLAEALGVSVGYISQVERGVTKISLDTLAAISNELECDLAELVTGVVPAQDKFLNVELKKIYEEMNERQRLLLLEVALAIKKY